MIFGSFLMFIAIAIAGVSAYFSVYGLAHIFAATFWSVVIMGGVLEVGKLVATSFLYRYWDAIGWYLRTYLLVAIMGLMVITSAGIFGYLSNAYQQDTVGVKDVAARIELLDTELTALSERDKQINSDIDRIGSNFVTARQNMMKQYGPEKTKITERIAKIRAEQLELSSKQLEVEAHTGPIIYIAKAMDKGIDEAVVWMIMLIIVVFDPLAVALTIGANIVLTKRGEVRSGHSPGAHFDPELLARVPQNTESRLHESVELNRLLDSTTEELAISLRKATELEQQLNEARSQLQTVSEPVIQVRTVEVPSPIPAGMQLVESDNYTALRSAMVQAADDLQALESEISHKQDLIETLSSDNQRLEDELFALASAFEKKEVLIAQLKDAIRALEQEQQEQQSSYTIQERADLHAQNIVAKKSQ